MNNTSKEYCKRKVALLCGSLYGGGSERFTVTLANKLSEEKKLQVYVVTESKKDGEYPLSKKVKRECLMRDRRLILDAVVLHNFLNREHIDIAIGIGIYSNLVLCLTNIFLKTKIIICERNDPKHDFLSWKSRLLRRILYFQSDYYVFQTEEAKKFYYKNIQARSFVIHNPVKRDLPFKSDVCKEEIVTLARLLPQKNYPMLLNAFKLVHDKHPEYRLRIFGEGKEKHKLEKLARDLQIKDAVLFEGFCLDAHERIIDSDIFAMSSDFEGMSNALMEAMAMGFPVVTTDCPIGGPAELIEDGVNGLLVEVGDAADMAKKLNYLIENLEIKQHIAREALNMRYTHSEDKIIKQWLEILMTI